MILHFSNNLKIVNEGFKKHEKTNHSISHISMHRRFTAYGLLSLVMQNEQ